MRLGVKFLIGAAAIVGVAGPASASGDYGCTQSWSLSPDAQVNCGNTALLNPANDSRVNLFLLQRNASGIPAKAIGYPATEWENLSFGHSFFGWRTLVRTYAEISEQMNGYGSRCDSLAPGGEAFAAAMAANARLPAAEIKALAAARGRLNIACGDFSEETQPAPSPWPDSLQSPPGRAFLGYLQAAEAFYTGGWDAARQGYGALRTSAEPWVAETATYMLIRVDILAAQDTAFDEYGDYRGATKTDRAAVARAQAAIQAYLKRYPTGRYAASAQGLKRRVLWLAGDSAALAREYERMLANSPADSAQTAMLIQEIDNTLLFEEDAKQAIQTPQLLAAFDLVQMRAMQDGEDTPPLSTADLAAQKPLFAGQPQLFAYLTAAQAYYVGKDYRRVLALLPPSIYGELTPLSFSQQTLRGMALAQMRDPAEKAHWQSLIGKAKAPYQRELAEVGLALAFQRDGQIAPLFAASSPVQDGTIREILLSRIAGPDLLRQVAADQSVSQRLRDVAVFALLHKDLATGRFADFQKDRALLSASASKEGYLSDYPFVEAIPVGLFHDDQRPKDFSCPGLFATADALARNPADAHARLCLGDFWRLNGFDQFTGLNVAENPDELGSAPSYFPGVMGTRAAIYASVMDDARAAADDRAYALFRAINCYAPSGNNDCGGTDVPVSQRRAWFQRLKKTYPQSRWARTLDIYW